MKLNERIFDDETQEWIVINDLSVAKYDVVVKAGPSYSTQRAEAAETMIQFAQAVPAAAAVMGDLIAQNMDWPGADTVAERLKKIVPPNVLTNEEREKIAEDMPEQPEPTPEQQIEMQELEVRSKEADASMANAEATIEKAEATVETAQAATVKAQLESAEAQAQLAAIEQGAASGDIAFQQVREMVAQAIAEVMPTSDNQ